MGNYTLGNPVRITSTPVDTTTGIAVTSVTAVAYIKRPDKVIEGPFTASHSVQTPPLLSYYYYDYLPLVWGIYEYRFEGTTPTWAEETEDNEGFFVEPSDFVT